MMQDYRRSQAPGRESGRTGLVSHLAYALLALLACGLFATLGAWQYGRGVMKSQRLELQAAALQAGREQPLPVALQAQDAATAIVPVTGRLQIRRPLLLLDGQQRGGRVGVRVYGLADPGGMSPQILVDLGWLPLPGDRALPHPDAPQDLVEIRGLLTPWPGQGLRAASNVWPAAMDVPVLLTYLDRGEIERAFGARVHAGVLRLAPGLPFGFERDLDALPNTLPPERHFGYALQWFALAATVIVVYFLLLWRSRRKLR